MTAVLCTVYYNLLFYISKPIHKVFFKTGVQEGKQTTYSFGVLHRLHQRSDQTLLGIALVFCVKPHAWLWYRQPPKTASADLPVFLGKGSKQSPQITNFACSFTERQRLNVLNQEVQLPIPQIVSFLPCSISIQTNHFYITN